MIPPMKYQSKTTPSRGNLFLGSKLQPGAGMEAIVAWPAQKLWTESPSVY